MKGLLITRFYLALIMFHYLYSRTHVWRWGAKDSSLSGKHQQKSTINKKKEEEEEEESYVIRMGYHLLQAVGGSQKKEIVLKLRMEVI